MEFVNGGELYSLLQARPKPASDQPSSAPLPLSAQSPQSTCHHKALSSLRVRSGPQNTGKLKEDHARMYIGEIALAFYYFSQLNIVYRCSPAAQPWLPAPCA